MKNFVLFKYALTNGLTWGIIGGLPFAFIHSFDSTLSRDIELLINFGFPVIFMTASTLTLNLAGTDKKYLKLFLTTLITFVLIFSSNPLRLAIINPFYREDFDMISYLVMTSISGLFLSSIITFLVTRRL